MARVTALHASDLHLDGPVAAPDPTLRPLAEKARRNSLKRLLELSRDQAVNLVLLPGDVFHIPNPPVAARLAFAQACQAWVDMGARVFISPGNHDPIVEGSMWREWTPPPGVTVFGPEPTGVELPELGLWIAGAGFDRPHVPEDLAAALPEPPPGIMGLACQHCDLSNNGQYDQSGPYAPTTLERLAHKGFAYWALGHWHQPTEFSQNPPIVMAGSPQGGHIAESGPRGAYLIRIEHGGLNHEFKPLAPLTFFDLTLDDWAGVNDQLSLARRVSAMLDQAGRLPGQAACLRLKLKNASPMWRELSEAGQSGLDLELKEALELEGLMLLDQGLRPALELEGMAQRDDVLGRMWRLMDQAGADPEYLQALSAKLNGLHPAGPGKDSAQRTQYLESLLEEVRSLALRGLLPGSGD